jgi:hypothetical protein
MELTQEQAEQIAAAVAQSQPPKERYLRFLDGETIYRIQPDRVTHFVGPRGEWEPLPYKWPHGIDGNTVPVSVVTAHCQLISRQRPSKTIQPKVGMLIQHRDGDYVFRCYQYCAASHAGSHPESIPVSYWHGLNNAFNGPIFDLNAYVVVESYTVQGAS